MADRLNLVSVYLTGPDFLATALSVQTKSITKLLAVTMIVSMKNLKTDILWMHFFSILCFISRIFIDFHILLLTILFGFLKKSTVFGHFYDYDIIMTST